MATKQTPSTASADTAATEPPPVVADVVAPAEPTPENTPVPGGGSWHWDNTVPGWVANS